MCTTRHSTTTEAVSRALDQHILRISKLLLKLEAKPAKVGPVPLFALGEPLEQFEVDLRAVLLHHHAEGLPRLNLLNSAGMKTGVYRVVIRLTEGDGPRVSEGDEYAFSTRDVMAALNHEIEPLFPNDPQTYWHRWQERKPCRETLRQVVELPVQF